MTDTEYKIISLADMLSELEESDVNDVLSSFSSPKNKKAGFIMWKIIIIVILFIGYTPILNKILYPNGKKSFDIIHKLSKDEFDNDVNGCKNYLSLKKEIINSLKKMNRQDFEENAISTIVNIEHINKNDFGNYMAVKFAYWAIILSAISTLYNGNVFELMGLSDFNSLSIVMIIFTVFLLVMGRTIHIQHNQLEYLNFKLMCINTIKCEREKNEEQMQKKIIEIKRITAEIGRNKRQKSMDRLRKKRSIWSCRENNKFTCKTFCGKRSGRRLGASKASKSPS